MADEPKVPKVKPKEKSLSDKIAAGLKTMALAGVFGTRRKIVEQSKNK